MQNVSMYGMSQDGQTEVPVISVCVQFSRIYSDPLWSLSVPYGGPEPKKKKPQTQRHKKHRSIR
jgi:hypothetical protein